MEFDYLILRGGCVSVLPEQMRRSSDWMGSVNVHRCLVSYVFLKAFDDGTVHPAAQTQKMIFSLQINSYEEILPELTILIERYCGWQCCQITHIEKYTLKRIFSKGIINGIQYMTMSSLLWMQHVVGAKTCKWLLNKTPSQDICLWVRKPQWRNVSLLAVPKHRAADQYRDTCLGHVVIRIKSTSYRKWAKNQHL